MSSDSPTLPVRRACASCGKEFAGGEITCSDDGTTLTPIHKEGLSGIVAGKYEIVSTLGGGGWGSVYQARHILLKRSVAIKTLHPHMVASGTALKRFKQEALAGRQLDHTHILNVLDFGITDDGVPYIVMDFLEGASLADTLQAGGYMEPRRAMQIFAQVASALAHAHRNGVIHRDLKPGNIMLIEYDGKPDYVKIVDFGIAKILHNEDEDETSQLTETGQLFGSPLYMSPEQCTGKNLDGRSDIYSFGCVMYRTLTGQPPFQVNNLPDCIYKHVNETPRRFDYVCPDRPIPKELEDVVFKALEKEQSKRFQTMSEIEEAITNWLEGRPTGLKPDQSATTQMKAPAPVDLESTTDESVLQAVQASAPPAAKQDTASTADQASPETQASPGGEEATPAPAISGAVEPGTSHEDIRHTSSFLILAFVATVVVVLVPVGYYMRSHPQHHGSVAPIKIISVQPGNAKSGDLESTVGTAAGGTPAPGSADPTLKAGIDAYNNGRYKEALTIFSSAAASSRANPKGNVDALLWKGQVLQAFSRYKEAKDVLKQYMNQSDDKGVNAARGLNALSAACYWLSEYDQARGYSARAEGIASKLAGPDRIVYAQTLRYLGIESLKQKDFKTAIQRLQMALSLNSELGDPLPLEKAKCEDALGDAHKDMKEYPAARDCYNTALSIRRTILSPSSPDIATSLTKLGIVDYVQKNFKDAEKQFLQALSINEQEFGENNFDVATILGWLAVTEEGLHRSDKALEYERKVFEILKEVLGETSPDTIAARNAYRNLERKLKHR